MKVLVTGAAGHIGQWVVRELVAHGHTVRALDRQPLAPDVRGERVEMVFASILDPLQMLTVVDGVDAVVHLAALPNMHNTTGSDLLTTNVIGTQNVLDAAMAHGVAKTVVTSSVGALGFSFPKHHVAPDYLPIAIDYPRRPQDTYGLSKLMNEESAAAATRHSGMTTIVFRAPFTLDLHRVKNTWLQRMIKDRSTRYESSLWAYIDVRDIAKAYRLALESDITGHHVYYVMADDVLADASAEELVAAHIPELEGKEFTLTGKSLYDLKPTEIDLGFRAEVLWKSLVE